MAEVWVAGATLAVGAYSAHQAGKAADAANRGQQAGIDEQRRQFDISQQNFAPYLNFGQQSLGQLGQLNAGDYSGFLSSPDYLAAQQGGGQMLDRSAAARGGFMGGGADADRIALGQQLASQYLGNFRNSLQYGAGLGQSSAAGVGSLGAQSANAISGAYGTMGANTGNAAINQANIWGNTAGQLGNLAAQYYGNRGSTSYAPITRVPIPTNQSVALTPSY